VIDESHQSVPQIAAMYRATARARRPGPNTAPAAFSARQPAAAVRRVERLLNQAIYVSATPSEYELQKSEGVIVEQIIRPTGLVIRKSRCGRSRSRWTIC